MLGITGRFITAEFPKGSWFLSSPTQNSDSNIASGLVILARVYSLWCPGLVFAYDCLLALPLNQIIFVWRGVNYYSWLFLELFTKGFPITMQTKYINQPAINPWERIKSCSIGIAGLFTKPRTMNSKHWLTRWSVLWLCDVAKICKRARQWRTQVHQGSRGHKISSLPWAQKQ